MRPAQVSAPRWCGNAPSYGRGNEPGAGRGNEPGAGRGNEPGAGRGNGRFNMLSGGAPLRRTAHLGGGGLTAWWRRPRAARLMRLGGPSACGAAAYAPPRGRGDGGIGSARPGR